MFAVPADESSGDDARDRLVDQLRAAVAGCTGVAGLRATAAQESRDTGVGLRVTTKDAPGPCALVDLLIGPTTTVSVSGPIRE